MFFLSFRPGRRFGPALLALVWLTGACCPPVILTESLPPGRVGEPYHVALQADCCCGFWWMSGELPVGMSFDSDGILKGAPRYAGLYFLTITWEDVLEGDVLSSVSKSFELLIVGENEPLPEPERTEPIAF